MRKRLWKSSIALAVGIALTAWLVSGAPPSRESVARGTEHAGDPALANAEDLAGQLREPGTRGVATDRRDEAKARDAGRSAGAVRGGTTPGRSDADGSAARPPAPDLRTRLVEAIERAERRRGLRIAPVIVDRVVERGAVRILFPVASDAEADTLRRLFEPGGAPDSPGDATASAAGDLRIFPLLRQGAARVDGEGLLALIESGATLDISLDRIHRPSLASTVPLIRADEAQTAGDDGIGRLVAVLDTGVDLTHPMFDGRIVEEACFSLLGDCPNDASSMVGPGAAAACGLPGCGHGTAVAGIALGLEPEGGLLGLPPPIDERLVGVAPASRLVAIQIFSEVEDDEIGAYTSDIVAGMQHVLALSATYAIDVVNLSLGGETYATSTDCEADAPSPFAAANALRDAGILTIAAAGNDGRVDGIASPACLSNVVGVGATRDDDTVAGFSNSHALLSLLAPGVSIETASVGGGSSVYGGTSMATPHASGAVALLRTRHPMATPSEIENALALAGVPVYDPRGDVTLPRLDVQEAIDLLTAAAGTPSPAIGSGGSGGSGAGGPAAASDGGGGACGLVGLEPFLVLAGVRLARRRHPRLARKRIA